MRSKRLQIMQGDGVLPKCYRKLRSIFLQNISWALLKAFVSRHEASFFNLSLLQCIGSKLWSSSARRFWMQEHEYSIPVVDSHLFSQVAPNLWAWREHGKSFALPFPRQGSTRPQILRYVGSSKRMLEVQPWSYSFAKGKRSHRYGLLSTCV